MEVGHTGNRHASRLHWCQFPAQHIPSYAKTNPRKPRERVRSSKRVPKISGRAEARNGGRARGGGGRAALPWENGLATQWQPPQLHTLTPCRWHTKRAPVRASESENKQARTRRRPILARRTRAPHLSFAVRRRTHVVARVQLERRQGLDREHYSAPRFDSCTPGSCIVIDIADRDLMRAAGRLAPSLSLPLCAPASAPCSNCVEL